MKVLLPCTIFLDLLFDLVVQGILGREVVLSPIMPSLFNQAGIDIDGDLVYTCEWREVRYLIKKKYNRYSSVILGFERPLWG